MATSSTDSSQTHQYHWDWNAKLNASPFRQEIKRLKADSTANPHHKSSNKTTRRKLRAKEKELLVEFQMKCDQAKIWINNAHSEYADEETESTDPNSDANNGVDILEQIAHQRQKEKIETIDQFWEELLCKETVHLQNDKMQRQNQEMADLERQLKEAQAKLDELSAQKRAIDGVESVNPSKPNKRSEVNKVPDGSSLCEPKSDKIPKKKVSSKTKRNDKDEYKGLVGFFNRPQKKKKKKVRGNKTGDISNDSSKSTKSAAITSESSASTSSESLKATEITNDTDDIKESAPSQPSEIGSKGNGRKKGNGKASRSMKGGFLNSGSKLYDDKKSKEDMTVDELNAKNARQIEEMGLKEATENPFFSWERPKMEDRKDMPQNENGDNPNPFEFLNKLNIQSNQK